MTFVEQPDTQPEEWGPVGLVSIAVGAFVIAVSLGLFMHTISQLASPIVCAAFIAAGIVGRRRAATPAGAAIGIGTIAGGVVAAIAGLALTATGH
jgi:hypothetical protein